MPTPLPDTAIDPSGTTVREIGRDAIVYGVGAVIARITSFLFLPVYGRYLTPADYGQLQLLELVVDVASITAAAGTAAALMRYYVKTDDPAERRRLVVSALYLMLGLNGAAAIVLISGAVPLARLALNDASAAGLVRIVALTFTLQGTTTIPLLLLQAQRRAGTYLAVTVAKLVLNLALAIVLVVGLDWGVRGVLTANLATSLILGVILTSRLFVEYGFRASRAAVRLLRSFSMPLQVATAGSFILQFGDRFVLTRTHGLAAVGLYGLAYQFGFLYVNFAAIPFMRAWEPVRLAQSHMPHEARDRGYNQAFRLLNLLLVTVAVGISLYAEPVLRVLVAPSFHASTNLVSLILLAFIFQTWTDVAQLGLEATARTKHITAATWIATAITASLYLTLIPIYGGLGAAMATVLGFGSRVIATKYFANRALPVAWAWGAGLRLVTFGSIPCIAWLLVPQFPIVATFAIATALMAGFSATLWRFELSDHERVQLGELIRRPREGLRSLFTDDGTDQTPVEQQKAAARLIADRAVLAAARPVALSVAICTRNRAKLLSQTLDNLTRIRVPQGLDWEVVVVDNGSSDGTREVVNEFTGRMPLRGLVEPIAGKSRALNRAVDAVEGEYVLWTDDDVIVDQNWLQAYSEGFREWPDASLFGGPVRPWFEVKPPQWVDDAWPRLAVAYATLDLGPNPAALGLDHLPHGANVAVRTRDQRRFLYDIRLGPGLSRGLRGEELTVFTSMLTNGMTGRWLPSAQVRHFIPTDRLRVGYVFDYFYGLGTYVALTSPDAVPLRMPIWMMKESAVASLAFCVSRPRAPAVRWVGHLTRAAEAMGWLAGARQRYLWHGRVAADQRPGPSSDA